MVPRATGSAAPATQAASTSSLAAASGPVRVIGEASSDNFMFTIPSLWPDPTITLIDISNWISGQRETFVPKQGQILGLLTEPLIPGPGQYQVNLPIAPTAQSLDVDNNGQTDQGVQIFALKMAANLITDSYLQQLEQSAGISSYLTDIATGDITEGTFLVYAPDDQQGFPTAIGPDGQWFTADDPTESLAAGYTLVTLGADGAVAFDRSETVTMNTIERAEEASPDFSDQGLVESFNSLIDLLAQRYAYTDLRSLDWEEIRQEYLPRIEEAEANDDIGAYAITLDNLAKSIEDSHVSLTTHGNLEAALAIIEVTIENFGAGIGARVIAVSDEDNPDAGPGENVVVLSVGEDSPATEAGWVPGTEIVSVNGQTLAERLDEIPLVFGTGVEEVQLNQKMSSFLSFPMSQTVTIEYRLPDSDEILSAAMETGDYRSRPEAEKSTEPDTRKTAISYEQWGNYAIVRWGDFMNDLLPKISVLEEALAAEQGNDSAGMILDLRGNSGGLATLYLTMASYFFTADDPMPYNVFDWYHYDADAGDLVKDYAVNYQLSAPRPELAFTGPLVVLVDSFCASACEYFSQHLQVTGRATVIGQSPSTGAGGPIDRVELPEGLTFQYTMGRTTFAGTDEPNLESKGVVPDIRVPVTLETELAKDRGEDPVLEAALAELDRLTDTASKLFGITWQWSAEANSSGEMIPVDNPADYTLTFAEDGTVAIQADCNLVNGTYALDEFGAMTIALGPATLAACPEGSRSDEFLNYLESTISQTFDGEQMAIILKPDTDVLGLLFDPAE